MGSAFAPRWFCPFRGTPIGEDVGVGSFMLYGCSPGPGLGAIFAHHNPLGDREHVVAP